MVLLRWILFPVALIYGVITFLRNKFYDWGLFKTLRIPKKSIVVGNLSTGGTGKTPHIDYLIQHFLSQNIKLCTLSRGYGRSSKGVIVATTNSTPSDIGDEPTQYKSRYINRIEVVVAEKRVGGIRKIQHDFPENELILLDDAFQHRAVKAGLNILTTPFDDLFVSDFMLPTGNLREWKSGKRRANIIVVSKTPDNTSQAELDQIKKKINTRDCPIFFSSIKYDDLISVSEKVENNIENVLLVTGIGNPSPLIEYWKKKTNVVHIGFQDHYNFTSKDITNIHEKFGSFASRNKVIITTEKDYMRLRSFSEVKDDSFAWHYQPITIKIDNQQAFNQIIDQYVRKV